MRYIVEGNDHDEYHKTDKSIEQQLPCNFTVEFAVADYHHHIPAVHYSVDINCRLVVLICSNKCPRTCFFYAFNQLCPFRCDIYIFSVVFRIRMSYDKSGFIHNKAIAFSVDRKLFGHLLYSVKVNIHGQDILPVGQHPAYGNDHGSGLRIVIRWHNSHFSVALFCHDIPVSCLRIVICRRLPVKTVHIFAHYISVYTEVVFTKLLRNIVGLFHQEFVDSRRCAAAYQHVLHGIRCDLKNVFGCIQMILHQRRNIFDPVLNHRPGIQYRDIVGKPGSIDHHHCYENEHKDHRYQDDVPGINMLFCIIRFSLFIHS